MPYSRQSSAEAIALFPVLAGEFDQWQSSLTAAQQRWLKASGFTGQPGKWCALPSPDGTLEAVAFGMCESGWLYQLSDLPTALPGGQYRLVSNWDVEQRQQAALGWGLAAYRFERYLKAQNGGPVLYLEDDIAEAVQRICAAQSLVRDLVNTPTEDMGPQHLAQAARDLAAEHGAEVQEITGGQLLKENFPAIHAVGRAAAREPRLVSLQWGNPDHPLLVLAGKGVCFDTGGLDIKSTSGMALMKKDMGGAAHVLALGQLVMQERLPVRLLVLIPAVENSISGDAYRPGDVIPTRKGLSIEIGNTDAEGRVVLSDALAFACEQQPDLVIDFATLTGAARVAMGPDIPPIFSNREDIGAALVAAGEQQEDPLWVLPLYAPYRKMLSSDIADLNNSAKGSYGGCITAALFLEAFVEPEVPWVHIDTFAWNLSARPGRPTGGEALGLRAAFRYLQARYGGAVR